MSNLLSNHSELLKIDETFDLGIVTEVNEGQIFLYHREERDLKLQQNLYYHYVMKLKFGIFICNFKNFYLVMKLKFDIFICNCTNFYLVMKLKFSIFICNFKNFHLVIFICKFTNF